MRYKVSYKESWSDDGTHYDQRITAKMNGEELDAFNASIAEKKRKINVFSFAERIIQLLPRGKFSKVTLSCMVIKELKIETL